MDAVQLQPQQRNYCAREHINAKICYNEEAPWWWKCNDAKHAVEHCETEDYYLRMREWERERRLRARQARIEAKKVKRRWTKSENILCIYIQKDNPV